jgi:membrane-bound lytic murein transglycosylase D
MPWKQSLTLACVFFLSTTPVKALIKLTPDFPMPPEISRKVEFWEKIFLKYPSTSTVIHDMNHAELIIDVIDFELVARKKNIKAVSWGTRQKITDAYEERYELALKRFHKLGKDALKYGAIEKRVWDVYSRSPLAIEELLRGQSNIRTQGGLSEVFYKAAYRAEFYLPYMEHIFESHGLPPVLTRLPFVESMFNLNAKSKQGALGIWQFMQTTAKKFLKVGRLIDERRSPFKATKAAAEYLKEAHQQIGAWPLTITSYNFGVNGMLRAINSLETRDIETIVTKYKSPSFQYASKNFYSEFLAAVLVYNHLIAQGRITAAAGSSRIQSFTLTQKLSVWELIRSAEISEETFRKYNPCVKEVAYTRFQKEKLPVPYEIFLPSHLAKLAEKQINLKYSMAIEADHSR